ncbi:beta-lactamase hydrolase domain-containing protein [Nitrosomonas sp. Is37]|uniref:beta-lactamase hydrolase domain-containing protein n=1 Tax=Nitrosomonas sp. Is37 TaxID=3080535 RepID=UPI00294B54EF|nr:sulfur transferase domain-containing protein [Nitrosomonas sp. Is37]MDV6343057.1 sulfur transferase domain-containing protein [Nitrosomonas sp. Is37]
MSIITTKLNEKLSVTGQISVDDLAEIAAAGYKSVICNRPDYEGGETQPTSAQLEQTARSLGLQFVYLPVEIGAVSTEKSDAFNKLLVELPRPMLAFCKSSN